MAYKKSTIIKRMLNKDMVKRTPNYGKIHLVDDYKCFIDGYRIMMDKENDYGYEVCGQEQSFDVASIVNPLTVENLEVIEIDRKKVTDCIKEQNRTDTNHQPYVIKVDGKYLAFNPRYLRDAIDFTGTNIMHFGKDSFRYGFCIKPVTFIGKNRNQVSVVLPVNIKTSIESGTVDRFVREVA